MSVYVEGVELSCCLSPCLGHSRSGDGAEVTFDGDTSARLTCTDKVVIRKAAKKTRLIKINQISFLEVLRTKMNGQ